MKLLPFNLERALAGDKVVTRNGVEVKQLTKFEAEHAKQTIFGVLNGLVKSWNIDGSYLDAFEHCDDDLFMAPKTVKRWVNFYQVPQLNACRDYPTEWQAREAAGPLPYVIAIAVPVEFEEGYGCE